MELFKLLGTIAIDTTEVNRNIDSVAKEAAKIGDGFKDGEHEASKSLSDIARANGKTVDEIQSDASKISSEYKNQGADASSSMKKAYSDIGTESGKANEKIKQDAKNASNELSNTFGKIGGFAKKLGTGILAVGGSIGGAFIGAVEGTREYRVEMGKLDTAFVTNGHSSEEAKRTYSDLNAVLGDSGQAVEASNHLALLTNNQKDLQTWTDICTGIYATFGDSLPIEGLTEAANETAKVGAVTGPLADALNWAGISEDSFNEKLESCSNEQERQKLIMDTLNGTYKKASDQYKETNKDVMDSNRAQERLSDALAEVGKVGEPVMNAIKNSIASMAEKAVPVITDIITKFQDMSKWVKDNEEKVKTWGAMLLIATATVGGFILVLTWPSIMTKAANALKLVTVAVKALNIAMRANVIGLVVVAIAGLVAAFVYLWNNCESFRNFWIKLWAKIVSAAKSAWTGIKKAFSSIGSWFKDKFSQVQKSGKEVTEKVQKFFSDAWKSVKKAWSSTGQFFKNILSGIKNIFGSIGSWFSGKFREAWSGVKNIWNNAKSFFSTVRGWVTQPFSSAKDFVVSTFGKIYSSIKEKINAAKEAVKSAIDKIKGFFKFKWSLPKLKMPTIGIKGKFGINPPSVPKFSIKWNASGGVFDKPTVLPTLSGWQGFGEDGAEAIVPLERNTQWIDRVAARMNQSAFSADILDRLNKVIELLEILTTKNMDMYLDSGALVGELAPIMDRRLGNMSMKKNRGNV